MIIKIDKEGRLWIKRTSKTFRLQECNHFNKYCSDSCPHFQLFLRDIISQQELHICEGTIIQIGELIDERI